MTPLAAAASSGNLVFTFYSWKYQSTFQAPIFLFKNRPIPLQAYDHSYIEIKLATEDVPLVKEHLTVMLWFRSGDVRGVRTLVDLSRDPIQLKQISHEVVA